MVGLGLEWSGWVWNGRVGLELAGLGLKCSVGFKWLGWYIEIVGSGLEWTSLI